MVSLSVASVCENVRLFRWVILFKLLKVHQIQNVNWNYILQDADFKRLSFEHHMIKSHDALHVLLFFCLQFDKSLKFKLSSKTQLINIWSEEA